MTATDRRLSARRDRVTGDVVEACRSRMSSSGCPVQQLPGPHGSSARPSSEPRSSGPAVGSGPVAPTPPPSALAHPFRRRRILIGMFATTTAAARSPPTRPSSPFVSQSIRPRPRISSQALLGVVRDRVARLEGRGGPAGVDRYVAAGVIRAIRARGRAAPGSESEVAAGRMGRPALPRVGCSG
jgi:hypothetical protein